MGGGTQIEQYRAEGRKIFSFVADFRALHPLWKRVIKGFFYSNLKNSIMLFWLGENATQKDFIDAKNFAESIGVNDGKVIHFLPPNAGKIFEPYLLRNSTHFITTRAPVTLDCLDFLYDTDIKIISALDDNIFEGEPAVNWQEIYF